MSVDVCRCARRYNNLPIKRQTVSALCCYNIIHKSVQWLCIMQKVEERKVYYYTSSLWTGQNCPHILTTSWYYMHFPWVALATIRHASVVPTLLPAFQCCTLHVELCSMQHWKAGRSLGTRPLAHRWLFYFLTISLYVSYMFFLSSPFALVLVLLKILCTHVVIYKILSMDGA